MTDLSIFRTSVPLEKVGLYTPLGIRFWDPVENRAVVDGLDVTARPPDLPQLTRRAYQTMSGIYAFRNLPGTCSLENSDPNLEAGLHPFEGSPPGLTRFIIEVRDRLARFLAVTFPVDLPYRGIYPTQAFGSPPGSRLPGFFLFSDPNRPTLSALAVVRAQLVERMGPDDFRPAAYAVLEVEPAGGPVWLGIANKLGSVSVLFPYPQFAASVKTTSPPGPPTSRLQTWGMAIRVCYRKDTQANLDRFSAQPGLSSLLNQPQAKLWMNAAGPTQLQFNTSLIFGQPLLLQTAGASELLIEP